MSLYLVQHGKSLSKEIDPEQGLSEPGIQETNRIAEVAEHYQVAVNAIVCSRKKRARQTAEIFAHALGPAGGVREIDGIKPMDDVASFAATLPQKNNLMIVSHLPFLSKLLSLLVIGETAPAIFLFQNSGIVCLDRQEDPPAWTIKWTLMPHIV